MKCDVVFTVPQKRGNLYRLPIGSTLLHFIAYDWTPFIKRCAALVRQGVETGAWDEKAGRVLREPIRRCHPYVQILAQEEFAQIVLDFAIDTVCRSRKMGLEELWAAQITAKEPFWREVFARISAYKTGRAINQWNNLLRMQQYAASKTAFVFDGAPASVAEYLARKEYYDLAFSLMAQEMGYTASELPALRCGAPAQMPGAAEMLGRLSYDVEAVVKGHVGSSPGRGVARRGVPALQDQAAGTVIDRMADLPRPGPRVIQTAAETCGLLPGRIYMPSGFKAVLDLEFDEMLRNGILLTRSPETGRFMIAGGEESAEAEVWEAPESEPAAENLEKPAATPEPEKRMAEPAVKLVRADPVWMAEKGEAPAFHPMGGSAVPKEAAAKPFRAAQQLADAPFERLQQVAQDTNDESLETPIEQENLDIRCQTVQNALRRRIGRKEKAEEFTAWSGCLMKIRIDIARKHLTESYLLRFLAATERIYQLSDSPKHPS